MYSPGQRVTLIGTTRQGTVDEQLDDNVRVVWDDNPDVHALEHEHLIVAVNGAPGPSYVADPVHEAMLRHARNAGAAVTALEIIRREALEGLKGSVEPRMEPWHDRMTFIARFCDDVLSRVLPA